MNYNSIITFFMSDSGRRFEEVRHDGRAAAADVLKQAQPRVRNLIGAGLTAQLDHGFDRLINARRATGWPRIPRAR